MKLIFRVAAVGMSLIIGNAVALAGEDGAGFRFSSPKHMAKQPVFTQNGMVTATSPLATYVGTKVLEQGGNAFDAAVAVALMLNATDPSMCGPSGAAFFVVYDAKKKEIVALDAGTQTPYEATVDKYKTADGKEDRQPMLEGVTSMAIPGAIAGYFALLERYGTKSFAELSEPAIHYLENGYPLSQATQGWLEKGFPEVPLLFPNLSRVYAPSGSWPNAGELMKNPELAKTYRTLGKEGVKGFYTGPIAKEMVDYVRANGGYWSMKDLADYKVRWVTPLKMTYRDYEVYGVPPPASSMTWMQMLKLAEQFDLKKLGYNSPEYLHLITEIERIAHADSYEYGGDPMVDKAPGQDTLSDNYIKNQIKRIDLKKAAPGRVMPGNPEEWKKADATTFPKPMQVASQTTEQTRINTMYTGNTTHVNVVDKDGNAVSFTHTLGTFFGGHDILGNTGVVGNNGINWGDLEISHWTGKKSNIGLAPGKRNRWTLCPGILMKNGKPALLIGGSGADTTQPAVFQSLLNMLEWDMNPQAAISAPRSVYGDMRHYTGGTRLSIDPEIRDKDGMGEKLKGMGHDVVGADEVYRPMPGYALSIMINQETGVKVGGAETRIDGHVNGY